MTSPSKAFAARKRWRGAHFSPKDKLTSLKRQSHAGWKCDPPNETNVPNERVTTEETTPAVAPEQAIASPDAPSTSETAEDQPNRAPD